MIDWTIALPVDYREMGNAGQVAFIWTILTPLAAVFAATLPLTHLSHPCPGLGGRHHPQRFQLSVQRRAFHADKTSGA